MFEAIFRVDGIPKGQPRPRAFATPQGHVRMYTLGTAEAWKSAIALAVKPHLPVAPISGPVRLIIKHFMPRPKSHYRTGRYAHELRPDAPMMHTQTPDVDNMTKAAMDALTALGVWRDDDQVCECWVTKEFSDKPGAAITIQELDDSGFSLDMAMDEECFL